MRLIRQTCTKDDGRLIHYYWFDREPAERKGEKQDCERAQDGHSSLESSASGSPEP
jgi:hypothetical protein